MKKKIFLILTLLVVSLLIACGKKHYNEWVTKDGNQYYYDGKGTMLKNCYSKIGSDTYVFNENGVLVKGKIVNIDGKPSFVDSNGKLKYYGWCSFNGNWYFVNQSVLQTGWIKDQGNWYYLDRDGVMQKNRWIDKDYFVDNEGKMVTNKTITISDKTYTFDPKGIGKEKPDYELVVEKYPNPFWAIDTLIDIKDFQLDLKKLYEKYYFDYEISFQVVDCEFKRGQNVCRMNYKIFDERGYTVDNGELSICPVLYHDYAKGEKVVYKGSNNLNVNEKGVYKIMFYSKKR